MAKNESFAYQHGKLAYHELTIKDRFSQPVQEPVVAETLQVGRYRREYWHTAKGGSVGGMTTPTGWKVVQTNTDSDANSKISQPVEWTFLWMHAPSGNGLYNPYFFGSNLEYRANLAIDVSDLSFLQGFCTHDWANCEVPNNKIWLEDDEMQPLYNRPKLLSKEGYIELMRIHAQVLSGQDREKGNVTGISLEEISRFLTKAFEHLMGFRTASRDLNDLLLARDLDELVDEYQSALDSL